MMQLLSTNELNVTTSGFESNLYSNGDSRNLFLSMSQTQKDKMNVMQQLMELHTQF